MDVTRLNPRWNRLRSAPRGADGYEGSDIELARRFSKVSWSVGVAVTLVLVAFYPPTKAIGQWGWAVANPGTLLTVAAVLWARRHAERVTYNTLYAAGWLGLAQLTLLQWLAGGREAPYHELLLFQIIGAALMHPTRRFVAFAAGVAVAAILPAVYSHDASMVGEIVTEQLLWLGLGVFLLVLMRNVRAQRVELKEAGDEAHRIARVDALTGLGNRRAFDEALERELDAAALTGESVSLLVADLNGFKQINDSYGHLAGDECLRSAAAALRGALRNADDCFRWGGDEFAVVLGPASPDDATALAARLEQAVRTGCSGPDGSSLTVVCGYAELAGDATPAEAVAAADEVLLKLKRRAPAAGAV